MCRGVGYKGPRGQNRRLYSLRGGHVVMAIAFLLQGALGGALLLILLFVAVVVVVVAAGVFGGAVGGRGGSGGEDASQTQGIVPPGTILAGTGMGLAVIGAFYPSL